MKALLWHRLSMQKWYILLLLIISLSITFINLHFFSDSSIVIFALIFSVTIVESMYTQDHKAKWELFVNSLPLTKKMQLQADYLYCYGLIALLFITSAPIYFSPFYEHSDSFEHFAIYFANISCAILLVCTQFYTHHIEATKGMRSFRMIVYVLLIFSVNFPIHYYLSMVAINLSVILIPTVISIIISIFVFRKCHVLYRAKEIY
ncbi:MULTISPECIES: ABC-2 transporter permease [unclassified Lysinibacillus]|uniref:ABC-2 transporter permease n=1 Tax=unclassified Lysinibacillus TaxID=2636778 RepID=UPI003817D682